MSLRISKKKKIKNSKILSLKKREGFKSPPVIFYYLIIVNYACFFGPSIFESIIETCITYLDKIETRMIFILEKYNHLLLKKYQESDALSLFLF